MRGKVCVITGATSGIGLIAAGRLAEMGARLVLVGRDSARAEAAKSFILNKAPAVKIDFHFADLMRLSEMHRVAGEIAAAEPRIDVLINNAGAIFAKREVTEDGLEQTFALNHMSYFVITNLLRDRLIAAAPSRIVNTASRAHEGAWLDFDDLQSSRSYRGFSVYSRSKLANILFTRELARQLEGTGVVANCLHPGFVATRIGDNNTWPWRFIIQLAKLTAISQEEGGERIVHLASSPEGGTNNGGYFVKSKLKLPSRAAQDDKAARRLWEESVRLSAHRSN